MIRDYRWIEQVVEDALRPDLPICDPHHHFWVHRNSNHIRNNRYLLDDLMADLTCGHNITSTVFIECRSEYRKDEPAELKPVGETEFVADLAEQSATGSASVPAPYLKPISSSAAAAFAASATPPAGMPAMPSATASTTRRRGFNSTAAFVKVFLIWHRSA